jgi:UDP:flavonoid glycosyltransferase YjiC (YdhE family)
VRIASQPALTAAITGAGLPAVEVGRGYDTLAGIVEARGGARIAEPTVKRWDRTGLAHPRPGNEHAVAERRSDVQRKIRDQAFALWVEPTSVVVPDLLRFARQWRPQLLIADALVFAAPLVAAALDIPCVRYIWGPDMLRQIGYPLQGQPTGADIRARWPTGLVELFDRFGVAVRDDYATATVDPWPGSLQLPGTPGRVPMRFVPYNGAAASPEWVLDRPPRPRVCVTWGTSTTALGGDEAFLLPRVVEALTPLDVEVVLAVSAADREKLGEVPGNCRVAESLPLHLVLPTCDAIVNQAGAATMLTAACHGLPQVLIPMTAESPFNAANFSASGAAIILEAAEASTETIGSAVTAALTDKTIRAAADKVRDEVAAAPPPAEVVRVLENLAGAG